jgi:basic membrane lipoprotein Med (substrate-binding protein (PBP1-ABC) superfamily)
MAGCGSGSGAEGDSNAEQDEERRAVGVVIDTGLENDKGFNEFTLKGARDAATGAGLDFFYVTSASEADYERNVESVVSRGADLVVTVGFQLGEATSRAARRHPDVRFVIVDVEFAPGSGCAENVDGCYSEEGGLTNVTSLMFAEEDLGYLAGTLAGCMTESGTIAAVGGREFPPVVRFLEGYRAGAAAVRPDVAVLDEYLPSFSDPAAGEVTALGFIDEGADVIFAAAGQSGLGALDAAVASNVMAIGVDVDQYYSVPTARPVLITSAIKNVDVATFEAVNAFATGALEAGVRRSTLANGGVGLAPFHDWENRIPDDCRTAVVEATERLSSAPSSTD